MDQETKFGYKDEIFSILEKAGCSVGDIIRITNKERIYEGILIPRSETSDDKHIVIKLKSGYNVGVHVVSDVKIEKVGKGIKPSFASSPLPEQKPDLPKVVILSTGGTIASRVDYRTGAVHSALSARDLYGVVPELANTARVAAKIVFSLYSENLTQEHWSQLAKTVAQNIKHGVDGVVIAHGTDTMAYTAAALSFALQNLPVPVIVVGAQRSSDRPSSDAATNLIAAVQAATRGPFAEVAIAMHETISDTTIAINKGTKVRKCHTSRRDAFKPVNSMPIARVKNNKIIMLTSNYQKRDAAKKVVLKPKFSKSVGLVKFHPGLDPAVIDWHVERGCRGILLEGSGLGHISKYCFSSIGKAVEKGVVVALASQCIWGRVNMNVYDTGRDLLNLGVVTLEDMFPETALVKLMWVLGQTNQSEEAKQLLMTNIAGEISPRTLAQKNEPMGGNSDEN